jgi:hypothetical protein
MNGIKESDDDQISQNIDSIYKECSQGYLLSKLQEQSLLTARELTEEFKPVPWYIWKLAMYCIGVNSSKINELKEGSVLGLNKIILEIANDQIIGNEIPINSPREALKVTPSDVIASMCILFSISKKLSKYSHNYSYLKPLLDDAYLRAQIGYFCGKLNPEFGPGRGILGGFAGRIGLIVLIAMGKPGQGKKALELLAKGDTILDVGLEVYECAPLHVSAFLLSASGVGMDAALGIIQFEDSKIKDKSNEFLVNAKAVYLNRWKSILEIIEYARFGKITEVPEATWMKFASITEAEILYIEDLCEELKHKSDTWNWMR